MIARILRHKAFLLGLVGGCMMTASWAALRESRTERRRAELEAKAQGLIERGAEFEEFFEAFGPWEVYDYSRESWWLFYVESGVYTLDIQVDRETERVVGSKRGPFRGYR